jgi:hypothetical protein
MEGLTTFINRQCTLSACCSLLNTTILACKEDLEVAVKLRIDCSCAKKRRCTERAIRANVMLQKDTIKLDFAATKESAKFTFRRSCLEVSEEICGKNVSCRFGHKPSTDNTIFCADDIDPSTTLRPTTMMATPPIHTDTCKLTTQGLQGNFSSKSDAQPGDQCQYCICADQPSKYLMLVIDQVPLD